MKKIFPGLILVILIALISMFLRTYLIDFLGKLTIGILLGIVYSNTVGVKDNYVEGTTFALKKILKWGIILLGVKLNFNMLFKLGPLIIIIILTLITIALILSRVIGKRFNINKRLSTLLGVGSSICGASAIVAMAPVIGADEDDTAISVAVISLLGAVGVLIYTLLAYILPINDIQYGIWSGGTLQGVAHALAGAGARGTESVSLEIGTIVKMARVALLAPVALILSYLFKDNSNDGTNNKVKFPTYVILFIIVGTIFTLNTTYSIFSTEYTILDFKVDIVFILKEISSFFILMAMVAMGLKVNFKTFKSKGLKALYTCSLLFICISIIGYILVQFVR